MPSLFWTNERLRIVRERYADADNEDLAREIGCTVCALQMQASKIGVRKSSIARGNAMRKSIGKRQCIKGGWTEDKVRLLEERYADADNGALALELGITRKALVYRASLLGLRKSEKSKQQRYEQMSRPTPTVVANARHETPGRRIATGVLFEEHGCITHYSDVSGRA